MPYGYNRSVLSIYQSVDIWAVCRGRNSGSTSEVGFRSGRHGLHDEDDILSWLKRNIPGEMEARCRLIGASFCPTLACIGMEDTG